MGTGKVLSFQHFTREDTDILRNVIFITEVLVRYQCIKAVSKNGGELQGTEWDIQDCRAYLSFFSITPRITMRPAQ